MQPRSSQEALSQYQTIQSSRKKPQDILRESEERLGIPTATQRQVGLRGAITNTENLIRGVDPSVSGRTQGSLVSEAQKQRLIAMEREPLSDQFREQSRALEGETTNISELQRRASQDAQLAITADDAAENAARGLYQTLYQREQDETARQERERAFQAQQAEARRASRPALSPTLGGGQAPKASDPIQQSAYDEVITRINDPKLSSDLIGDIIATQKSANYGNVRDKYKIETYKKFASSQYAEAQKRLTGSTKILNQPGLNILGQQTGIGTFNKSLPAGLRFE